jgi:signal recognition particle subunit SRP19
MRNKETSKPLSPALKNKFYLYILIAQYLQAHPTTKESPLKLQLQGVPAPEKLEPPAVLRGWKINEILPLQSSDERGWGVGQLLQGYDGRYAKWWWRRGTSPTAGNGGNAE